MALRVLLADESTTIKKVIQLALQDFAVEVKSVHSGVDVLEVTKAYAPDIIFADVLLPKKNGYEVSAELKADGNLQSIPVVIMWSSFMDLDEKAFLKSQANARLEKPFDVENLRALVTKLVVRAQSSRLAPHLQFPHSFADPLRAEEVQRREAFTQQQQQKQQQIAVQQAQMATAPAAPTPPPPDRTAQMQRENLQSQILQKEQELQREQEAAIRAHAEKLQAQALAAAGANQPKPPATPPLVPPPVPAQARPPMPPPIQDAETKSSNWNMDSFGDINEFAANESGHGDDDDHNEVKMVQLNRLRTNDSGQLKISETAPQAPSGHVPPPAQVNDDDKWARKDLSSYRVQLPEVQVPDAETLAKQAPVHRRADQNLMLEPPPDFSNSTSSDLRLPNEKDSGIFEFSEQNSNITSGLSLEIPITGPQNPKAAGSENQLDIHSPEFQNMIRQLVHTELQKMIQQVVPELATKLIQAELSRLLSDTEPVSGAHR